jgi:hypothetical protein
MRQLARRVVVAASVCSAPSWAGSIQPPAAATPPQRANEPAPQAPPIEPSETSRKAAAAVSRDALMEVVRSLPPARSAMGGDEDAKGLAATEALITTRLAAMGYEPRRFEFPWTSPARRLNKDAADKAAAEPATALTHHDVFVDLPGAKKPSDVLLVSCHFDAVLHAPGADDDGTGVAAVLELARIFKELGPADRTIRLMFFNLEEVGLVGSRAYASSWAKEQRTRKGEASGSAERIVGMMSLEMLGYFTDAPDSQKSPIPRIEGVFEPSTVGDTIAVVGLKAHQAFSQPLMRLMKAHSPELKITSVDFMPVPVPDMMRSDHQPFIIVGQPAVMLTDTANFRNPNYHKPTDAAETIDAARFTQVVRGVAGAVRRLAESHE